MRPGSGVGLAACKARRVGGRCLQRALACTWLVGWRVGAGVCVWGGGGGGGACSSGPAACETKLPPPVCPPPPDTHERLAALAPTPDGRLLLAAGTSGLVTLRWLHSLAPVLRYDAGRGPVTALALTPGGCFLAGEWVWSEGEASCGERRGRCGWGRTAGRQHVRCLLRRRCCRCGCCERPTSDWRCASPLAPALQAPPRAAWCCSRPTRAAASPPVSTLPARPGREVARVAPSSFVARRSRPAPASSSFPHRPSPATCLPCPLYFLCVSMCSQPITSCNLSFESGSGFISCTVAAGAAAALARMNEGALRCRPASTVLIPSWRVPRIALLVNSRAPQRRLRSPPADAPRPRAALAPAWRRHPV